MPPEDANRRAWNALARENSIFAAVASDEECAHPLQALDGRGWLPADVTGLSVLCLAAGGGWQSILYALAGANVTVVDLSEEMLRRDVEQSALRNVRVRTVRASMTDLSELASGQFDIVQQPVSTCYIADLLAVYREVVRVLQPGGLYISQHKQPTSLQVSHWQPAGSYAVSIPYYHTGPLPAVRDPAYREAGTLEFLHRWEDLVGGMCRAGLAIEDLVEPRRGNPAAAPGDFQHRGMYVPPYVRIKARKPAGSQPRTSQVWIPREG